MAEREVFYKSEGALLLWVFGEFDLDHARFEDNSSESEQKHEYVNGEWDASEAEAQSVDAIDKETGFTIAHKRPIGSAELQFGVDWRSKKRDITYTNFEWEADNEGDPVVYELDGSIGSLIEETRVDPYVMVSGKRGAFAWEAGLRYETTRSDIRYREDGEDEGSADRHYNSLLPKYCVRYYVKPGITGLSQVSGYRGEIRTDEDMENRIITDMYYVRKWSFPMDLLIICKTVYYAIVGDKHAI